MAAILSLTCAGCSTKLVKLVPLQDEPLRAAADEFRDKTSLDASTIQTLHFYSLDSAANDLSDGVSKSDPPDETFRRLREEIARRPTRSLLTAAAEWGSRRGRAYEESASGTAAEIYVESALYAYRALFDEGLGEPVNPFSSEFRTAAASYNRSLERLLRLMREKNAGGDFPILPGEEVVLAFRGRNWRLRGELAHSGWTAAEIGEIQFASDYRAEGLNGLFAQEGLGLPIVVRRNRTERREDKYYPPDLAFPMTLFLRPSPGDSSPQAGTEPTDRPQAVLEFHDPFTESTTEVNRRAVDLESDFSTPLAFNFADPATYEMATVGLRTPEIFFKPLPDPQGNAARPLQGLYFMQPYSPDKIPVVLIHGLWSSPITWLDMVNALESVRSIRENYQFWFYTYPTGLPWWVSAAALRNDLAQARAALENENRPLGDGAPATFQASRLDEMVLIGHSMGGLIARLQVTSSGNEVWNLISDAAPSEVFAQPPEQLLETLFFEPNPSVRRVVSIATPYRGSGMVNGFNERLAQRLISAPTFAEKRSAVAAAADATLLKDSTLLTTNNSVESLSPDDPFFRVLDRLPVASNVAVNNMIGVKGSNNPFNREESDGVVERQSAELAGAESEITVESAHMTVHRDPATIRETGRILLEHLNKMNAERTALGKTDPAY